MLFDTGGNKNIWYNFRHTGKTCGSASHSVMMSLYTHTLLNTTLREIKC